ncbi:Protein kinase domain-containing protein [Actinacidiphila rubida]|uniref:non-specific serine/threonine protein kinase n=2 Tax=Actinacidiphila rubida TaxID=310780 RepID=A0A1H8HRM4_9ACTN|nr:Protein kinase domain-containing protein [Actinacidiphila rubida]
MGTVYLSHTRGGQPVALKVIRREYAQDEEFRRRFQQEVLAARRVQGFHVVPVVDHDTTGGQPWLATTYVPGMPLDEALARHGPLPLPAVLQLVGCTAEALRAVHAGGVIHRDLKPSNILLAANGPWVIDFGIARAADSTQITRSGGLIGTPQFMSPEHANGLDLTPASDLFSLGLIAAVAATGRHPYGTAGAITLATKIANTAIRPPDLSGYPDALRPLLERCLTAEPADRPSPAQLAELCEQAAGRPLREFTGWLPAAVAADIAVREAAAAAPPEPEGADGTAATAGRTGQVAGPTVPDVPPTVPAPPDRPPSVGGAGAASAGAAGAAAGAAGAAAGGGGAAGAPPARPPVVPPAASPGTPQGYGTGPSQAYGPGTSFQAYPPGPAEHTGYTGPQDPSAPPPAGWSGQTGRPGQPEPPGHDTAAPNGTAGPNGTARKVLVVGGMVIALVLAVTLTWALARQGGSSGSGADGRDAASGGTGTASGPRTTHPPTQAPATTGTGVPAGDAPTTPATPTATGDPQLLFQNRKFVLRPPAWNSGTHVDLDHATAAPNAEIGDTDGYEIEYQDWGDSSMRFLSTFGKSDGTTYEACREGVGADALPGTISKDDLDKDTYFTKGSVLCTVTTDGNLAMLQITGETKPDDSGSGSGMPGYTALLTVWRMPGGETPSPGSG